MTLGREVLWVCLTVLVHLLFWFEPQFLPLSVLPCVVGGWEPIGIPWILVTELRAHCQRCLEAKTMALAFEKRRKLILQGPPARRQGARLKSVSLIQHSVQGFMGLQLSVQVLKCYWWVLFHKCLVLGLVRNRIGPVFAGSEVTLQSLAPVSFS